MTAAGARRTREFWRRYERARRAPDAWPPPAPRPSAAGARRSTAAASSAIADDRALASSGEPVLALCADALRRRELVERAARPARFGGGELAIVSAALARRRDRRGRGSGARRRRAAWSSPTGPRSRAIPALAGRCEHVVVIDPPPFARTRASGRGGGEGYVHRSRRIAPRSSSPLRVHAEEWPSRASLAALYRVARRAVRRGAGSSGAPSRPMLCGERRAHPLRARGRGAGAARVLVELDLAAWDASGGGLSAPGVVSSRGQISIVPRPSSPIATGTRRAGDS